MNSSDLLLLFIFRLYVFIKVIKGEPFLDNHYFLYHDDSERSRRHKRAITEQLGEHPAVEWVHFSLTR